jgi:hypothetical protein
VFQKMRWNLKDSTNVSFSPWIHPDKEYWDFSNGLLTDYVAKTFKVAIISHSLFLVIRWWWWFYQSSLVYLDSYERHDFAHESYVLNRKNGLIKLFFNGPCLRQLSNMIKHCIWLLLMIVVNDCYSPSYFICRFCQSLDFIASIY